MEPVISSVCPMYSSSQSAPQHTASTTLPHPNATLQCGCHLRSNTLGVTGCDLQWRVPQVFGCVLSHLGAPHWAHCTLPRACSAATLVILCKGAPVRWYLIPPHLSENTLACLCLSSAFTTMIMMSVMRQNHRKTCCGSG